jgi:DNA-binding response OmpR family regulator
MKVLIIEDDPILSKNIKEAMISENRHAECVFDGVLAEKLLQRERFDCIIMDINLPGKNGFELCRTFREFDTKTPVIMLTAFGELEDKIQGYDCGADDYLTKPFFMKELVLRVNSLLKRNSQTQDFKTENVWIVDDITMNDAQKKVFRQGQEIELTPREYQILRRLMQNKGEVVSKADLIKEIWGSSFGVNTNTIEVYVNFIRSKIDKPFSKNTVRTKVGYGYYLDVL